jgi:drug/metabolite transporter (DMT)-like permease
LGGNGGVVLAQHYISSSLAALLVATEPFWIIILSWLWLKKGRPTFRVALGLAVGFIGVGLLVTGQTTGGGILNGGFYQWLGTFAVIASALLWAAGSLYGLKAPVSKSALTAAGMQMISGGLMLLIASLIRGEWWSFDIAAISGRSWAAFAYLTVFGSLIGFTAYSWLLKNAQPSKVATYAYVNPVVAVLLGWGIAGESLTMQMLVGAGIVVISVALVTWQKKAVEEQPDLLIPGPRPNRGARPSYSTLS